MHEQCYGQRWDKISRRCFLAAAAGAAGFALAGPALAERMMTPNEGLDSTNIQSQSSTDPSPLIVACPDCCRVLSNYRNHA
jgi:hypothetical protein